MKRLITRIRNKIKYVAAIDSMFVSPAPDIYVET